MRQTLSLLFAVALLWPAGHAQAATKTFGRYVEYFYDRYSSHFDTNGFTYAAPSYGLKDFGTPGSPRDKMLMASYYRYRAIEGDAIAQAKLREETLASAELLSQVDYTKESFGHSQGAFLIVCTVEQVPELFSSDELQLLRTTIVATLPRLLSAPDTGNRSLILAAHTQYLANYLLENGLTSAITKEYYDVRLRQRVNAAVKSSISKAGWYREGGKFTAHYHAVSAFMLQAYGRMSGHRESLLKSRTMYLNLKKMAFGNSFVEAKIGYRPIGHGAQFYLMMGGLGLLHGDAQAHVFLAYADGARFFSQKQYPNRLEFHSTVQKTAANYHDDIAFSDIAELALTSKVLPTKSIASPTTGRLTGGTWEDDDFKIVNTGSVIAINDKKRNTTTTVRLGSYGNWSRLH